MSKKQPNRILHAFWLLPASSLLLLPGGLPLAEGSNWWVAGATAAILVAICNVLNFLGPLPRILRFPLALPILTPAFAALFPLNHPFTVCMLLLPWAYLLYHGLRSQMEDCPKCSVLFTWFLMVPLCMGTLLMFLELPPKRFPRLIFHQDMWILAITLIPIGLSIRPFLRPFARKMLKTELILLMLPLWFLPWFWAFPTSFKETGESLERPDRRAPLPWLIREQNVDWFVLLPESMQQMEDPYLALQLWDHLTKSLTPTALEAAFTGPEYPLPPPDMIRALKLYDFLQQDRHGYFVPASAFTRTVPAEMDPDAKAWILKLREHIAVTPEKIAQYLDTTPESALYLLRLFEQQDLIRRVPTGTNFYRPSATSRHPTEAGWLPHQLLMAADTLSNDQFVSRQEYGLDRGMARYQALRELDQMLEQGLLRESPMWKPNQYRAFLQDRHRVRTLALWMGAIVVGLIIGVNAPVLPEVKPRLLLLILIACLLVNYPWQGAPVFWLPVRLTLSLWLFRSLGGLSKVKRIQLAAFAVLVSTMWVAKTLAPASSPYEQLEAQAAWAMMWLLPTLPLLFFSLYPLPPKDPT